MVGAVTRRVGRALADRDVWGPLLLAQMRRLGVDSVPIALFIAVFTGIVLALLASYIFTGTVPLYFVGALVGKTVMMELARCSPGMALAGRVGANIAAELGTMKVTEQVDALETLAYDPRRLPRRAARPRRDADVPGRHRLRDARRRHLRLDHRDQPARPLDAASSSRGCAQFYQFKDIWFGLVKAASFGARGGADGLPPRARARAAARGVGRATTRAVVLGCEAILVLDAFWALVLL